MVNKRLIRTKSLSSELKDGRVDISMVNNFFEYLLKAEAIPHNQYGRSIVFTGDHNNGKLNIQHELETLAPSINTPEETNYFRQLVSNTIFDKEELHYRRNIISRLVNDEQELNNLEKIHEALNMCLYYPTTESGDGFYHGNRDAETNQLFLEQIVELDNSISAYNGEEIELLDKLREGILSIPNYATLKEYVEESQEQELYDILSYKIPDSTDIYSISLNESKSFSEEKVAQILKKNTQTLKKLGLTNKEFDDLPFESELEKAIQSNKNKDDKIEELNNIRSYWIDVVEDIIEPFLPGRLVPNIKEDKYNIERNTFGDKDQKEYVVKLGFYNLGQLNAEIAFYIAGAKQALSWKQKDFNICLADLLDPEERVFSVMNGRSITFARQSPTKEQAEKKRMRPRLYPNYGPKPPQRNIEYSPEKNTIFISGPNAAGKTTILRETIQHIFQTYLGLYTLADSAKISPPIEIVSVIAGEDNMTQNLSGYATDLDKIKQKVYPPAGYHPFSKYTLLLMDEFGRTTDDKENLNANIDILEHIYDSGTTIMVTTHDEKLIEHFQPKDRVVAMQVGANYDHETQELEFTRTYTPGIGDSLGFILAKKYKITDEELDASYQEFLQTKNDKI